MADIYEHPKPEVRHKPTVKTGADMGARVECLCGWSLTARKPTECLRAYRIHVASTTQREGAQS